MTIIACSTDGCVRPVKVMKRGLCGACYIRWQRASGRVAKAEYGERCAVSFQSCMLCRNLFTVRRARKALVCRDAECARLLKNSQQRIWFDSYRAENGLSYSHSMYSDARAAYGAKRRQAILSGEIEVFDVRLIFDRDGWVCQLCNGPVDGALRWPSRMSKSLDHVIPVSKGGSHTVSNVQLAHLGCNASKGNRVTA